MFIGEVFETIVDVGRLLHRELEEPGAVALIDHEGEVSVCEEFVGDLLDVSFAEMRHGLLVGHVEGDDVSGFDLVRRDWFVGLVTDDFPEGGVFFLEVVSSGGAIHEAEGKATLMEWLVAAGARDCDEEEEHAHLNEPASNSGRRELADGLP